MKKQEEIKNNNIDLHSILKAINNYKAPSSESPENCSVSYSSLQRIIYTTVNSDGSLSIVNTSATSGTAPVADHSVLIAYPESSYGVSYSAYVNGATTPSHSVASVQDSATGVTTLVLYVDTGARIYKPCYIKGTMILMADGSKKSVEDITYSDNLLVWDFDRGEFSSANPLWIKKRQYSNEYCHCAFENGLSINLVGNRGNYHRGFCLDTNRFEYFNRDCIGKDFMTSIGPSKLVSLDIVNETVEYYNIITKYHMNLYSDDILTSTGLNNVYPIKDMKFIKEDRDLVPIGALENCPEELYYGLRLGEQRDFSIEELNERVRDLLIRSSENENISVINIFGKETE